MFAMQHTFQQRPVTQSVFRAYDIRGIIDEQFNAHAFYSIAKTISCRLKTLQRKQIFVARDGRLTSEELANALILGLLDSGIDVYDLGEVPTPLMYFATQDKAIDCGLMVTGSHNPAPYNGIKMVLAGKTLVQDDIQLLYELNQSQASVSGEGQYHSFCVKERYVKRVLSDVKLQRSFKVVVDCGNGIASELAPLVIEKLGCEVIPLFCEVDGRFPNHHPDPTVESNLVDLKQAIATHQADLGLAFDGDGDRLGVVTNEGELIWPDRLMMMYAGDLLQRNPGASIVYDVKCSKHLTEVIEAAGGQAIMCPTGHSIVKGLMKQKQAALAGEMSGHIFFKDRWYGFDDALYSACRLLEILSASPKKVSEQFALIPNSINTPEIKIPISDTEKFVFMKKLLAQAHFTGAQHIETIDGLRVEFKEGWGLVRASNTTPCLVARFEADSQLSLTKIQGLFREQLQSINPELEISF